MSKIWFTSDIHHSHKNIVKFTKRSEETTAEEHNEWLVRVWNSHVGKGDTVYHLGDYSFAKNYDEIANFTRKLNGNKFFLKGNHDDRKNLDRLVKDGLISTWWDYKEIKIDNQAIVLFHFPILSWHKQSHGSWHLHGHCHGNLKQSFGKMLDVGIDSYREIYGKNVDHIGYNKSHGFSNGKTSNKLCKLKKNLLQIITEETYETYSLFDSRFTG